MWSPALPSSPLNWGLVRTSYPRAYRALFETGEGTKLNTLYLGDPTPQWFSGQLTEQQLLDRAHDADDHAFRRFELSDLITFFAAYQYVFSVRGLRTSHPKEFPATWRYGYTLCTPRIFTGPCHPDGPYPFPSHAIAQQAAFLMGFHLLDNQLRP